MATAAAADDAEKKKDTHVDPPPAPREEVLPAFAALLPLGHQAQDVLEPGVWHDADAWESAYVVSKGARIALSA